MNPGHVDVECELERLHEESFAWALSCCAWDRAEAEDVLQVTYVRVISGKARFDGKSRFRTWLFGVIRLVAMERRRRTSRRARLAAEVVRGQVARQPADAQARLERGEQAAMLRAALARLPERQREVLHLVFYEGLTVAESADVMGVGVGSARTHYARGKARLRQLLSEVEP